MTLPVIKPDRHEILNVEPLTPTAFAPFGTVIASPSSSTLTSYPATIPDPAYSTTQPRPVSANQATALKTSPISPLTNNYHAARQPGTGLMSIFSSFPRQNAYTVTTDRHKKTLRLKLGILERHPYTTQTFCPFNYSLPSKETRNDKTHMLVIVAPTLQKSTSNPPNPPDLTRIRAFLAPLNDATGSSPNMAVTYAPGTWHAPMIVLESRRVDFLVTQFANGVAEDDCQEVLIGSGPDSNVLSNEERKRRADGLTSDEVEVDVSFLQEDTILRAKL